MSALDDKIDDLYQQPLGGFIGSRNALAKTLSGADATGVKALPKPTVVAWAANQVYWRARSTYDALMRSGERVRKAQIAALQGKAADVRAANEDHRRAVAAAVSEAERLASDAGSKPSPDALTRTFEALSLTPHPPDPPGRLVEGLQPASGFEALAGITPAGPAKAGHYRDRNAEHDSEGPALAAHHRGKSTERDSEGPAEAGHYRGKSAERDSEGPAEAAHHRGKSTERDSEDPALAAHHRGRDADGDSGSVRLQPDRDRDRKETKREREAARRAEEDARAAATEARRREAAMENANAAVASAEAAEKLARASWEQAHDALLEARRKRDEIRKSLG